MQFTDIEIPESNNEYTKCENCKKNILSSKMFLHEGFCIRNNTVCPKCEKVILKKDYEAHMNDHLNPCPKIFLENSNEENENSNLSCDKNNYYPYVKINCPIKNQEIIKVNEPIVIVTSNENQLNSQEEYADYFIKNYEKATLLHTNIINDIGQNNENIFQGNEYSNTAIENQNYNFNNYFSGNQNSVEFLNEYNDINVNSSIEPLNTESVFTNITQNYEQNINFDENIPESYFKEGTEQYNFNGNFKLNDIEMINDLRCRENPIASSNSFYGQ